MTLPDTPVMYVAGEAGKPIAEQARGLSGAGSEAPVPERPEILRRDAPATSIVLALAIDAGDDPASLPHPTWTLPGGGKYVRRRVVDWERQLDLIGPTIQALLRRPDVDPSRPCLEYYRSQKELLVLVPVLEHPPR